MPRINHYLKVARGDWDKVQRALFRRGCGWGGDLSTRDHPYNKVLYFEGRRLYTDNGNYLAMNPHLKPYKMNRRKRVLL